ncbi:unnamed protein product [Prorocentrum cordatum]|uniref:Uncharacterized protein n=1 Tax=Prorocentrum cordatum TaxID=2364126 RepID=A0ABN9W274_9DINO|nr:unnamed protein product [Polarella glacialis]
MMFRDDSKVPPLSTAVGATMARGPETNQPAAVHHHVSCNAPPPSRRALSAGSRTAASSARLDPRVARSCRAVARRTAQLSSAPQRRTSAHAAASASGPPPSA